MRLYYSHSEEEPYPIALVFNKYAEWPEDAILIPRRRVPVIPIPQKPGREDCVEDSSNNKYIFTKRT